MAALAINGGNKLRKTLFPAYDIIGNDEQDAVRRVIKSGILSKYIGGWCEDFYGGPEVQALEQEWADYYGVKYAVSVNSATAGLYCAVGATLAGPGDEIIVSPYTMCASATSALIYNAIPIFADIEEDYFCLDPDTVQKCITEHTKAIVIVDIFGQPYDYERINEIAQRHGLIVIEDASQSPGAKYGNKFAGTLGDIGIYSLNYHKHIHSGEGGVIVTNNKELAERMQMIRNHAEAVVEGRNYTNLVNMIGFNYRMTELEAAVARSQLKKLNDLLDGREQNVKYLEKELAKFPFLEMPKVRKNCKHSYYVHAIKFKKEYADGVDRDIFVEAVSAELMPMQRRETEGIKIGGGYTKPLYLQPMYQNLMGYGNKGCPFKCSHYQGELNYEKGLCPVCEDMYFNKIITHEYMRPGMTSRDLDDVIDAFDKVWTNRHELKNHNK